jgi:FKBP-type peptidyl-prolyl cis-trans isomerase
VSKKSNSLVERHLGAGGLDDAAGAGTTATGGTAAAATTATAAEATTATTTATEAAVTAAKAATATAAATEATTAAATATAEAAAALTVVVLGGSVVDADAAAGELGAVEGVERGSGLVDAAKLYIAKALRGPRSRLA